MLYIKWGLIVGLMEFYVHHIKKVSLINKIKFEPKIAFSNSVTIYPGIVPIPVSYVKLNFCNSSE